MRVLLIFVAALLLAGCSRQDTKLQKQIAGTWTRDDEFQMRLSSDGSVWSHWASSNKSLTYQGTWKIRAGNLVTTLTNCIAEGTTNFERVGNVDSFAIIRADATDLIYSNNGQRISLKRK